MSILEFRGTRRYLSSFWPCIIEYEGLVYPSTEHAFQAAKSLDIQLRLGVAGQPTPGKAKRAGRNLVCRPDWQDVKLQIMHDVVLEKFTRHSALAALLLDTRNQILVEGNTWDDTFWGVCRGEGTNHLGKILMQVREEIYDG